MFQAQLSLGPVGAHIHPLSHLHPLQTPHSSSEPKLSSDPKPSSDHIPSFTHYPSVIKLARRWLDYGKEYLQLPVPALGWDDLWFVILFFSAKTYLCLLPKLRKQW